MSNPYRRSQPAPRCCHKDVLEEDWTRELLECLWAALLMLGLAVLVTVLVLL